MNTVTALAKGLINLIYPLHCASCGKHLESTNSYQVCDFCRSQIKPNLKPYCSLCGRSIRNSENPCQECRKMHPYFDCARSACLYEDPLKTLIHKFKYNNVRALAGLFSAIMLDFIKDNPDIIKSVDVITFIPLHTKRSTARGFNQSELIASSIGNELGIPARGCMEKISFKKNQNELSREDRLVNINDTFKIRESARENIVRGSDMLIIDDVMTTGATLNEASRILIDSGAERVRCLTLARGA